MKFFLLFSLLTFSLVAQQDINLRLWYDRPAANWNEALPIGNGKLAAMVFGEPAKEQLQLNEESVWAGGPNNNIKPDANSIIRQARKLIFEGRYVEAQELVNKEMTPYGNSGMPYQPIGNLYLKFPGHEQYSNFYRELDIQQATTTTSYKVGGVEYRRVIFASLPNKVIVVRLEASQPEKISCTLSMDSPQQTQTTLKDGVLILSGIAGDHEGQKGSVKFQAWVDVKTEGGSARASRSTIEIVNATAATIYISIGTNFKNYNDLSGDPSSSAQKLLTNAMQQDYNEALTEHIRLYRNYFDRVSLRLSQTDSVKNTTKQRIQDFKKGNDPQLLSLYFQYGRYLLISSSFPGSQPANLQGKWNPKMQPPWDSKYTININTEMNYWPAEVTNLPEMHQPLFDLLSDLSITGKQSAGVMYHARGWMAHHNTDIWRITGQVDPAFYGLWPMGGAWLSRHLWEHYLFTGDRKFLKWAYPILKGVALYFIDALQEEPTHHWLVVSPSISPENSYIKEKKVSVTAGCTMDNQIVFELFSNTIRAAEILGIDARFADTLTIKRKQLPPMHIGKYGQLQEWLSDWDDPNDKHRHISHLFGLYPGNQISPWRTPELVHAARTTLEQRGDLSTGWSMGWKVNFWARMLDGDRAYKLIRDQLSLVEEDNSKGAGGTYANMFDAHPPFQIDGNFGCTAGIAEMLLQSHDAAIQILPALPEAWPEGNVKGLVARGGFVVDVEWAKGKVQMLTVKSRLGGYCRLRTYTPLFTTNNQELPIARGENTNPYFSIDDVPDVVMSPSASLLNLPQKRSYIYDVTTQEGKVYTFKSLEND